MFWIASSSIYDIQEVVQTGAQMPQAKTQAVEAQREDRARLLDAGSLKRLPREYNGT